MLKIKNLKAGVEEIKILNGINLCVNAGEVHAIMGPNGSGKSTLSAVIAGNESYEVESGSIIFEGEDLLDLDPDQRAHKGVFLSFGKIPKISSSFSIGASLLTLLKPAFSKSPILSTIRFILSKASLSSFAL